MSALSPDGLSRIRVFQYNPVEHASRWFPRPLHANVNSQFLYLFRVESRSVLCLECDSGEFCSLSAHIQKHGADLGLHQALAPLVDAVLAGSCPGDVNGYDWPRQIILAFATFAVQDMPYHDIRDLGYCRHLAIRVSRHSLTLLGLTGQQDLPLPPAYLLEKLSFLQV